MTFEERCDAVAAALGEGDLASAEVHLRSLSAETSDPQFREDLQVVVKSQHLWIAIARMLGFLPPNRFPMAALLYWILTGAAVVVLLRLVVRPEVAGAAVAILVGMACVVALAHIVDAVGTLVLRARGDHLAVSRGEAIGAAVRIGALVVAIGCGLGFAATHTVTWVAAALLGFVSAKAAHHVFALHRPLGRLLLGGYAAVGLFLGLVAAVGIAREVPEGVVDPPLSLWSGVPALISVLLLSATGWVRPFVLEVVGGGMAVTGGGSFATRPGQVALSDRLLRLQHPELYGWRSLLVRWTHHYGQPAADLRRRVRESIGFGDAQPAVVLRTEPLQVAAYSDDLDAAVLLEFPQEYVNRFELVRGKRLVSINTYFPMEYRSLGDDIEFGPESTQRWGNVSPHIADFLTEEQEKLQELLSRIDVGEWDRLKLRLKEQVARNRPPRDGRALYCGESRMPVSMPERGRI